MKIKIVSDGSACNTKVVNAETGELITGVIHIHWTCDASEVIAKVFMEIADVAVDLVGNTEEQNVDDLP